MSSHGAAPLPEEEPLRPPPLALPQQAADGDQRAPDGALADNLAKFFGYFFIALNSAAMVGNSSERAAPFVVFTYLHLLLFLYLYCLARFQGWPRSSPQRDGLKAPLLVLGALLSLEFAYQLTRTTTASLTPRVWAIAAATGIGAFYYAVFQHEGVAHGPFSYCRAS